MITGTINADNGNGFVFRTFDFPKLTICIPSI